MKVLLNSFHLHGHTLGFHPQTFKLKPPCRTYQTVPPERTVERDNDKRFNGIKLTFLAKNLKSSVFRILPDLQSTLKKGFRQFTTTLESCEGQMESKNSAQN